MAFHKVEVGQLYLPDRTQWPEIVEWNYTPELNELRMFQAGLRRFEVDAFKRGLIDFSLAFKKMSGFPSILFLVFHIHAVQRNARGWDWSDAPYTYHMLPPERRFPLPVNQPAPSHRALLQMVLVEAKTGIVQALRQVSFSPSFTRTMYQSIEQQAGEPFDQDKYDLHLALIYRRYQSKELREFEVAHCMGGE